MTGLGTAKISVREKIFTYLFPGVVAAGVIGLFQIVQALDRIHAQIAPIAKQADYHNKCIDEFMGLLKKDQAMQNFSAVNACSGEGRNTSF